MNRERCGMLDKLRAEWDGRKHIVLLAPLRYRRENGVIHVAETYFRSDGGSIPRLAWSIIGHPLSGEYVRECVIHDRLCTAARNGESLPYAPDHIGLATRKHADTVFYESLRCAGVPDDWNWRRPWRLPKARLMYYAVRIASLWKR